MNLKLMRLAKTQFFFTQKALYKMKGKISMISWMSNWAQGIIVALIVGTIIEMILPNGNNKKYVKH